MFSFLRSTLDDDHKFCQVLLYTLVLPMWQILLRYIVAHTMLFNLLKHFNLFSRFLSSLNAFAKICMSSSSWIAPAKPSESDAKAIRQSSRNARYSGWSFGLNISLYFSIKQNEMLVNAWTLNFWLTYVLFILMN